MNLGRPRWRSCSSAAALWAVALVLAIAGCGKRDEPPSKPVPDAKPAAQAPSSIGRIHAIEGDVRILGARGEERAQAGVLIDRSETVRTMPNAWALLAMADGATITMRADTELRFDDYRYDPDGEAQQNTAAMSLVRGALRSITGLIGQTNAPGYRINTPTATIGIRGTDHEPAYYPAPPPGQKAEHPPGTYDKVNSGETVIRRPAGEIAVRRGQTAYAPVEVQSRPQILERVPVFYQRHAEVDRRVVDRREEFRRQFVEQHERRQQERERQRLEQQKRREQDQKQRLDDQKKKQDDRARQQDTLKKKQDEQRQAREKKQDEQRREREKKQDEQKREREKKQEEAKKRREEQKKKQEDARQEQAQRRGAAKAPEKEAAQKDRQDLRQQQRQQQQQQRQQQQQEQRERQQRQEQRLRQQREQQERARQQLREQTQGQQLQRQLERQQQQQQRQDPRQQQLPRQRDREPR